MVDEIINFGNKHYYTFIFLTIYIIIPLYLLIINHTTIFIIYFAILTYFTTCNIIINMDKIKKALKDVIILK